MSYPDVLMATVGGLLFVGVGAVSARAARRRLSYETWYYLHLYTYLAIALAFSHQFADGAEFIDNRPARMLMVRAVPRRRRGDRLVPLRRPDRAGLAAPHAGRSRVRRGPGRGLDRHPRDMSSTACGAESGQFFRWRFLTRELWWASNPYSLSAAPRPDRLRITVKNFGEHSSALFRLKPGTRVFAEGPYGAMTAARRRGEKVLLVAGGIGVTPLRALFESVPAAPRRGHPALPHHRQRRRGVPRRAARDRRRARRPVPLAGRQPLGPRPRPALGRGAVGEHPRSAQPRRVPLRARTA